MMKTPFALTVVLVLVLAGCAPAPQGPALAATIHRDCGPADGPAFTLEVPMDERGRLVVSIWQAPELAGPTTFTLTDPTDATGSASLVKGDDTMEPVTGTVTFNGVSLQRPVGGSFRIETASGEAFKGLFSAQWVEFPALCG